MKTGPLFVIAVVLLAVACAVWAFTSGEAAAPAPARPPQSLPFADWPISPTDGNERHLLDPEPASAPESPLAEPSDQPPAPVDPWLARFLVVDEDDVPVAGAVVRIRESWRSYGTYELAISEHVLLELLTDAAGRAQTTLRAADLVADARKDKACSGPTTLSHTDTAETTLRVDIPVTVRGIVLRADGQPAAGAKVRTLGGGSRWLGTVPVPPTVTAGSDGRFEVPLQRSVLYVLVAQQDGDTGFQHRVWFEEQPPEVTLTFPGGITIEGVVVDTEGNAVAGAEVRCRRGVPGDPWLAGQEPAQNQTDEDGRFRVAVQEHTNYQVLAKKAGHANSAWHRAETTAARPHAQVRLQLLSMATIRGRVERSDGSAFERVVVGAEPEGEQAAAPPGMTVDERFPPVANVATGADGAFELAVHPDTTWTLSARPYGDQLMELWRAGVRPGDEGVVIRLTAEELSGCIVHIHVVRADGKPAEDLFMRVCEYRNGKASWGMSGLSGSVEMTTTLPRARQYALLVEPPETEPVAPALVGPFWTDRRELHFEARLEPWGEIPVRVLDASGAPARRVWVDTVTGLSTSRDHEAAWVDADGRVVLKRRAPGAHTLRIQRRRGPVPDREIVVQPGLNPEVVVRLPASK